MELSPAHGAHFETLICPLFPVAIIGLQVKIKINSTAASDVVFKYQAYMKLIFTKTPSTQIMPLI